MTQHHKGKWRDTCCQLKWSRNGSGGPGSIATIFSVGTWVNYCCLSATPVCGPESRLALLLAGGSGLQDFLVSRLVHNGDDTES